MRRLLSYSFALIVVATTALAAQSTQATRGAATSDEERERYVSEVEFIRQAIVALATAAAQVHTIADVNTRTRANTELSAAIEAGATALAASNDPTKFQQLAIDFRAKLRSLAPDVTGGLAVTQMVVAQAGVGPPPQIFTAVPDVVFTTGVGFTGGPSSERYSNVDIATNLIGAAAGVVFDALGEKKLAEYLKNNLGVGVGFPLNKSKGKRTLTNHAGIGLGEVMVGKLHLWPVLSSEQSDTTDRRVPQSVVSGDTTQKSWSTPTLAVSGLSQGWLLAIRAGKLRPIFTVGVRFPQYYPGDPYAAIGALFSGSREKYRRAGGYRLTASVAIPMLKVKGP